MVAVTPRIFSTADALRAEKFTLEEISEFDANNFAANALVLGQDVVLQTGPVETSNVLRDAGFNPVAVETSEFMKSGGSVFCLKMMVY